MKAAENRKMQDLIQEVNIPMETVTEHTDAGEKTYERKVFPRLRAGQDDNDGRELAPGAQCARGHGLCGDLDKAIPLTDQEIYDLGVERHEVVLGYEVGDTVRVTDGPLEGFLGTVEELEPDKDRVRVVVSMFGRETPVDLDLDQVEPLAD